MSGIPGSGGRVPKRSDQRRRTNKDGRPPEKAAAGPRPAAPDPGEDWHEIARDWFVALSRSGQSAYYEASDWATARYVAQAMSKNLSDGKFSAMLFASVMSAMSSLLVTEGDRRRLRLELERVRPVDEDGEAATATVLDLQSRLGG